MALIVRVVRSDGAIIAGPYPFTDLASLSLVDIPAAGSMTYRVQIMNTGAEYFANFEGRLSAMQVKR